MRLPTEVENVLNNYDSRAGTFGIREVERSVVLAMDADDMPESMQPAYWAERAAFRVYIVEGALTGLNDPSVLSADVISHWATRSEEAMHPVLVARYSDLVWEYCEQVTGTRPSVDVVHRAIDSYILALNRDEGAAWGDSRRIVERVLSLAMSIRDTDRIARSVEAILDYSERTGDVAKPGTYCYLMELLILRKPSPKLTPEQRSKIIDRFEQTFEAASSPKSPGSSLAVEHVGNLLAEFYHRENRPRDRSRVLSTMAKWQERKAGFGSPMRAVHFLDLARRLYREAGEREEADRVARESEEIAPAVKGEMTTIDHTLEIPEEDVRKFCEWLEEDGLRAGLLKWAAAGIPQQSAVEEFAKGRDENAPLYASMSKSIMGQQGIVADLNDASGDPDGAAVVDCAQFIQLTAPEVPIGLRHLIENGLEPSVVCDSIVQSIFYDDVQRSLIQRGIEAHCAGDFLVSVHVLIPQIERALRRLLFELGEPSVKPHRSGRGVMQYKSMNDALDAESVRDCLGQDLTIYLTAVLSHPKGMNLRNRVCHGLMEPLGFTREASERVIHCLTALSLWGRPHRTDLRGEETEENGDDPAIPILEENWQTSGLIPDRVQEVPAPLYMTTPTQRDVLAGDLVTYEEVGQFPLSNWRGLLPSVSCL